VLTFALFCAVFCSITWAAYAISYINSLLDGISFFDAGIFNVSIYGLFILLPIFLVWQIFGFFSQYLYNRSSSRHLYHLFSQMKKNQEYSDLLARIMLELEQNIKNSSVLNCFELLISDMNELLSELILRHRIASQEQVEHLWVKVQNGGKWSFGKVLVENYNRQPMFQEKIYADASSDSILSGTILEICARYQTLLLLLEKHDKDKVFLNIVETGVLGKVYAILAPVSERIRLLRETFSTPLAKDVSSSKAAPVSVVLETDETPASSQSLKEKLSIFKKNTTKPEVDTTKDEFSLALERSFGTVAKNNIPNSERAEPSFDAKGSIDGMPDVVVNASESSDTEKMLNSLKKEWREIENKNDTQIQSDEELSYPFGGWTDADKYQK